MKMLKPGLRPFVAIGTIFGLLLLLPLIIGLKTGNWGEASKMMAGFVLLPAAILIPIAFTRLEVDEEKMCLRGIVSCKYVRFDDIGWSVISVLAERDRPLSLTVFGRDMSSELITIRLKIFPKEDVAWLVALPRLKVTRWKNWSQTRIFS
jgi:hypothetical protein